MEKATVTGAMVMGDYYYEEFDTEGYKIRFESDREIVSKFEGNLFLSLEYFECHSDKRYPDDHAYSVRDYYNFSSSQADIIDRKPSGIIIYEAQLEEDSLRYNTPPICAQVFVNGNTNRKIWHPSFISNKIELEFPK